LVSLQVKDVKVEKQEVDDKTSKYSGGDENEDLTKVPKELELDETLEKMDDDDDGEHPKLSKRKLKKLSRLSVAELKQLVTRPGKNIFLR
jgi:splicing factor 3B subunit 2